MTVDRIIVGQSKAIESLTWPFCSRVDGVTRPLLQIVLQSAQSCGRSNKDLGHAQLCYRTVPLTNTTKLVR